MAPDQLSLLDAGLARGTDPATAKDAAARIDTSSQKAQLLRWLDVRKHPLTRDVLHHLTGIRPDVVGTRLSQLAKDGLVRKVGVAAGDAGIDQTTWTLTFEGRHFVTWRLGK